MRDVNTNCCLAITTSLKAHSHYATSSSTPMHSGNAPSSLSHIPILQFKPRCISRASTTYKPWNKCFIIQVNGGGFQQFMGKGKLL